MSFANATQITETEKMIRSVLNAIGTWAGAVDDPRRFTEAITKSRIYATLQVIEAIAKNPQHGYWGMLADDEDIDQDEYLPAHIGAVGVPSITPFPGANTQEGIPADPDEIDSYRNDTLLLHSPIRHNAADENNMPSELAGKYSLVGSKFKFTGHAATIPMIIFSESSCATRTPVFVLPTIVKLAPLYNAKEGDNLLPIMQTLAQAGQADLQAIEGGAMEVSPVSDIVPVQKNL